MVAGSLRLSPRGQRQSARSRRHCPPAQRYGWIAKNRARTAEGKAWAPKSSGGPEGQAGFQGRHHPDANLLAAFVEKTLTEKERTRVLHHLAQCAECREVAAFALPAEAAAGRAPARGGRAALEPWLVLRWGAMAAVLGTLAVVVVLHPDMWKGHQQIWKERIHRLRRGTSRALPKPSPRRH